MERVFGNIFQHQDPGVLLPLDPGYMQEERELGLLKSYNYKGNVHTFRQKIMALPFLSHPGVLLPLDPGYMQEERELGLLKFYNHKGNVHTFRKKNYGSAIPSP